MLHSIFAAGYAPAHGSLADPPGSSVLLAAVSWIQGTLLGTLATSLAILAVACVGYAMLTGRLGVRPAASVVLGSFILFGASTIVAGIQASASSGVPVYQAYVPPPPPAITQAPPAQQISSPPGYDPHAGASVPGN